MNINLPDYQNRNDPNKFYARHLFRSGRGIQAAEFNEIQDVAHSRLKSVTDTLYSDGDIVSGCEIGVDLGAEVMSLGAGYVYIGAEVHAINAATMLIPPDETVVAGIWYTERIITEVQDGTLRDPAVGCANYQQPGAARLKIATVWGLSGETHENGQFYALHTVSDGEVVRSGRAGPIDQVSDALARYDYDSNGSYVIEGLTVRALPGSPPNKQTFSVAEGRAHVVGFEVVRPYSQRLVLDERPSINEVEAEEHIFNPDQNGAMRVNLRHTPAEVLSMVKITRQRTVTLVHGNYSGASDPLPDESVMQIVGVTQSGTTYVQGTDYRLTADAVDWSPYGAEPATGSTYTVTYQYRLIVQPDNPDTHGFTVSNAVAGQLVQVRYSYRLPRVDVIALNRDGEVFQVLGVPHRNSPVPPTPPNDALRLATIEQRWEGLPTVINDAIRVTNMKNLDAMKRSIIDLYDLTAQSKMTTEAMLNAQSSVRGLFVDPFLGDNMRDQGIEQTGAVVRGELMLPIDAEISQAAGDLANTLDFVYETILEQPARSGSMKINPYQAQDPIPAKVTLDPSVDRWQITETEWTSEVTKQIVTYNANYHYAQGSGIGPSTKSTNTANELVDARTDDTTIRPLTVALTADGFGANEHFTVTFDGVEVQSGNADANGAIAASFVIPEGIPSGTKLVTVSGAGGSRGEASYTASGTITTETRRVVNTITTQYYDPLAQTFALDRPRLVSGADIWFTVKGASEVRVQIRDTLLGFPNRSVLAEGRIKPADIHAGQPNRIVFDHPLLLLAGTEYALTVLSDTSDHEIAIAELGKWDITSNSWLTRQAYQTGVLLSSSNAATWTPHQTMDMWFRLLGAKFTSNKKTVSLGTVTLSAATDLLPLAEVDFSAASCEATFILRQGSVDVARVQPGQTLSLSEKLTGDYSLFAELTGEADFSPILYGGAQLIAGIQRDTADYVSRAFVCGINKRVIVTLDTFLGGSSNLFVYAQTGADTSNEASWTEAELQPGITELGDGWRERVYKIGVSAQETRVKIILTGSPSDRPRARSLRAVVIDA
ncbi:hypothetical protein FACS1894216_02720 [Synergistales bacterium]|nr:hypothetical protein FACS1894216_02720 [Synergistales bacterium]